MAECFGKDLCEQFVGLFFSKILLPKVLPKG